MCLWSCTKKNVKFYLIYILSVLIFWIPNLFEPVKKQTHNIYEELLLQFMYFYGLHGDTIFFLLFVNFEVDDLLKDRH